MTPTAPPTVSPPSTRERSATSAPVPAPAPTAAPRAEVRPGPRPGSRRRRPLTLGQHLVVFVRELSVVVVGALVVSTLLRAFVGQMYDIPSASMSPTLQVGDRVLVEKLTPIDRGDVVVFRDPGGWLATPGPDPSPVTGALEFIGLVPASGSDHVIKRIVGLPGDTVVCCDDAGRITVNRTVIDEPYLQGRSDQLRFTAEVPAGRVFVMGDNRGNSRDSRCHLNDPGAVVGENAFVPIDRIVGRAVAVVWPAGRWHTVDAPQVFAAVAPGREPAREEPLVLVQDGVSC